MRTFMGLAIAIIIASMNPGSVHAAGLTADQQNWVDCIKQCLMQKKISVTGARPGCRITEALRVECLKDFRQAGAACVKEVQSGTFQSQRTARRH
jgi:hypothetical protein